VGGADGWHRGHAGQNIPRVNGGAPPRGRHYAPAPGQGVGESGGATRSRAPKTAEYPSRPSP
jgi:hypothetical protein